MRKTRQAKQPSRVEVMGENFRFFYGGGRKMARQQLTQETERIMSSSMSSAMKAAALKRLLERGSR